MSGIYLHIPFCKQACHYCNFHFSTSLRYKGEMVSAIIKELEIQQDYLQGATIETIYLGGGTPSLLDAAELDQIFTRIYQLHKVSADAEVTLEANPDDLTKAKIEVLKNTPVNRFSIGIQSFFEEDLLFMNRAHNAGEAAACIENVKTAGFENITIDLIYGTPTMNDEQWKYNIQKAMDFAIPHLSCYCLTVEPGTALAHFVKTKKAPPVDEERAARQFEMLLKMTAEKDFVHYEISNFGKKGFFSRHNTAYWQGKPYLGIGPSAHSFAGQSRQWNIANNQKYLKALAQNELLFEKEILSPADQYNEYIMTGLRTIWGVDLNRISSFGTAFQVYFLENVQTFLNAGDIQHKGKNYVLSSQAKFRADGIAAELFFPSE